MQQQRSGIILGLLALGLLVVAALIAGPAQAASGVGPFFPDPAWDRKLPAAIRFFVLTNWSSQAVLDKETGLVWERTPSTPALSYFSARFACIALTTGNRKGWRLPSVHELASLVDPSVTPGPTLPVGHPFTEVQLDSYWSATTTEHNPTIAWSVFFANGNATVADKTEVLQVWCVRGGMNADAY